MKVSVRLFAAVRQITGRDQLEIELAEGATIGDLRRRLAEKTPQLSDLLKRAMFAIDTEYAADGQEILADADVACIPPVSGG